MALTWRCIEIILLKLLKDVSACLSKVSYKTEAPTTKFSHRLNQLVGDCALPDEFRLWVVYISLQHYR